MLKSYHNVYVKQNALVGYCRKRYLSNLLTRLPFRHCESVSKKPLLHRQVVLMHTALSSEHASWLSQG